MTQARYNKETNCLTIENSFEIKEPRFIKGFLRHSVSKLPKSYSACLNEWYTHNLLYYWGYQQERTKTVDINKENFFHELGYFFGGIIYRIVWRSL